MSSPEHGGFLPPEHPQGREQEPGSYSRAARFAEERTAQRVYARAQGAIFRADCDLSAFRFHLTDHPDWYVAVFGTAPPPALDEHLTALLAAGEAATLPPTLLAYLAQRRAQARMLGPWVERHVYPTPPTEPGSSDREG